MIGLPPRRSRRASPAMLAGWLFADLLLMLFLLGLAGQASPKSPAVSPTQSESPSPSPSPSQGFISKDFCEFLLPVNTAAMSADNRAAASDLITTLNQALTGQYPDEILADPGNPAGSRANCLGQLPRRPRAGVVIAYGASQSIGTGIAVGQHAVQAIIQRSPRFNGASSIWGWTGEYGDNKVELIVFFISS
jgi:hypothetical protein